MGPARRAESNGDNDEDPCEGWFLVWVSAASEKPILIEHDCDVHNWDHLVVRVEGPYSRTAAKMRAIVFHNAWV